MKFLIIFFSILFLIAPFTVKADAFLYFEFPRDSSVSGDEFIVVVKLNTGGTPVNTVKTVLYFPKDQVEVIEISKQGSIFSLWAEEPKFSNESGEISFVGGLPHPGFNGSDGNLLFIKFKANKRGGIELNFGESAILASDGKGTDIYSHGERGRYVIKSMAPEIISPTHPDEEKWYSNNNLELEWNLSQSITDVSFILDKNAYSEPGISVSAGRINSKQYSGLSDGIWYFHLKTRNDFDLAPGEIAWGATRHFRVRVDTASPLPFEIVVNNEGDSTNPRPILYFNVLDATSGLDYYRIEFETGDSVVLANPGINQYQLPLQEPGIQHITVRAYDKAGNSRENIAGVAIQPIKEPTITIWPRIYTAGEERFYVEGEAVPQAEVTIFLEKDKDTLKEWRALSDNQGVWKFSTHELLGSGIYNLFTKAKDMRGALSELSTKKEVEVILSGIALGSFMVTYRNLVAYLAVILLILAILAAYFIIRISKHKKALAKETKEAEASLHQGFSILRDEIVKELKKLETVKSGRDLSEKEQEIIKNLQEDLAQVEKFIGKEIRDVEKELK